ncbi:LPS export ABC transporter periplasmic protein LptC [Elizabethkingia sp. JS20170427COW]|uniref:LPS export ABC transporter periplasmic protein LptC n=1 Tax=Elizabethkingia sp. JS20170427COW TaxID=2583851 RepID=UPI001110CD44|nr:LPS export ABC transporter periplasmic protein LptC [Elizabethkingia sp. JS20170427COW]QCX54114.1 LPS export ABC transporter periplasmic protein LptC [Elizabethkingia sp. JS20170427COW]
MNRYFKIFFKNIAGVLPLAIFFLTVSCEEDLAQKYAKKKKDFASQILYNTQVIQHDSGRVMLKVKAPIVEKYEFVDTPYVETKKGLYIEFYDKKTPKTPGKLWANYAKMIEAKQFYVAKGDVKIINPEGQTFKMQSLYWDKSKRRMYTRDTVYITDKDGNILIGAHGMNAKDDFSSYSLYSSFGSANAQKLPEMKK